METHPLVGVSIPKGLKNPTQDMERAIKTQPLNILSIAGYEKDATIKIIQLIKTMGAVEFNVNFLPIKSFLIMLAEGQALNTLLIGSIMMVTMNLEMLDGPHGNNREEIPERTD